MLAAGPGGIAQIGEMLGGLGHPAFETLKRARSGTIIPVWANLFAVINLRPYPQQWERAAILPGGLRVDTRRAIRWGQQQQCGQGGR